MKSPEYFRAQNFKKHVTDNESQTELLPYAIVLLIVLSNEVSLRIF